MGAILGLEERPPKGEHPCTLSIAREGSLGAAERFWQTLVHSCPNHYPVQAELGPRGHRPERTQSMDHAPPLWDLHPQQPGWAKGDRNQSMRSQAHRLLAPRPWGRNEACLLSHSFPLCFAYHRHVKLLLVPNTVLEMTAVLKIVMPSPSSRSFNLIIIILIYQKPVKCLVLG